MSCKGILMVPDIKESTIIRLLEAGDERCMKMMFDTYYQALCTYIMRYLISVEDAEDIVQMVFISLWNNKRGQVFTGSLRAYLFGAVSKASLQFMRDRERMYFVEIELHIDDFLEEMSRDVELEKMKEYLYAAIEDLPANPKKVLTAIVFNNTPYKVVAEEMGISVNTVKTYYARALQALRKSLDGKTFCLLFLSFFSSER
ncbi:RNA polymerase sigma factor [Butyricimonas virosa]